MKSRHLIVVALSSLLMLGLLIYLYSYLRESELRRIFRVPAWASLERLGAKAPELWVWLPDPCEERCKKGLGNLAIVRTGMQKQSLPHELHVWAISPTGQLPDHVESFRGAVASMIPDFSLHWVPQPRFREGVTAQGTPREWSQEFETWLVDPEGFVRARLSLKDGQSAPFLLAYMAQLAEQRKRNAGKPKSSSMDEDHW